MEYVMIMLGSEFRPVSADMLLDLLKKGEVSGTTPAWIEGRERELREWSGFAALYSAMRGGSLVATNTASAVAGGYNQTSREPNASSEPYGGTSNAGDSGRLGGYGYNQSCGGSQYAPSGQSSANNSEPSFFNDSFERLNEMKRRITSLSRWLIIWGGWCVLVDIIGFTIAFSSDSDIDSDGALPALAGALLAYLFFEFVASAVAVVIGFSSPLLSRNDDEVGKAYSTRLMFVYLWGILGVIDLILELFTFLYGFAEGEDFSDLIDFFVVQDVVWCLLGIVVATTYWKRGKREKEIYQAQDDVAGFARTLGKIIVWIVIAIGVLIRALSASD